VPDAVNVMLSCEVNIYSLTAESLKDTIKALRKKYHPDGKSESLQTTLNEKLALINSANDTLTDYFKYNSVLPGNARPDAKAGKSKDYGFETHTGSNTWYEFKEEDAARDKKQDDNFWSQRDTYQKAKQEEDFEINNLASLMLYFSRKAHRDEEVHTFYLWRKHGSVRNRMTKFRMHYSTLWNRSIRAKVFQALTEVYAVFVSVSLDDKRLDLIGVRDRILNQETYPFSCYSGNHLLDARFHESIEKRLNTIVSQDHEYDRYNDRSQFT
jgi:hypothetical protein